MGTFAGALEARHIPSAPDKLRCEAAGTLSDPNGVLTITRIDVTMFLRVPKGKADVAKRVSGFFERECPIHQSLKAAIDIVIDCVITEE